MAQVNRSTIHHREYISFILINVRIKDLKNILFLNLTMIRPCEIDRQLSLRFRVLRAQISTNLEILLYRDRSTEQKMKRNFCCEMSAMHCGSFSFKWTAGRPSLVTQFPDLFLDFAVSGEITRTLVFGFEDCFAKQNTWYIKLFRKPVGRITAPASRNLFSEIEIK